jgi:hypothetical protein
MSLFGGGPTPLLDLLDCLFNTKGARRSISDWQLLLNQWHAVTRVWHRVSITVALRKEKIPSLTVSGLKLTRDVIGRGHVIWHKQCTGPGSFRSSTGVKGGGSEK